MRVPQCLLYGEITAPLQTVQFRARLERVINPITNTPVRFHPFIDGEFARMGRFC
jgi:hypothetical protein